jgi:hypothetical protein
MTVSHIYHPENCGSLKVKPMLLYRELQYIAYVRTKYEALFLHRNLFTNMTLGNNSEDPICKNKNLFGDFNIKVHLTNDSLNIEMNATNLRAKLKTKQ